jgi:hypothetical protein
MNSHALTAGVVGLSMLVAVVPASAQVEGTPCAAEPTDQVLAYGDFVTCQITPLGDSDLFRFQGVSGEVVTLRVTDPSGGSSIPACRLELLRPGDLSLFASTAGNTTCEIRTTLDASGLFTLRVTEIGDDHLMNYALEIDRLFPSPARAAPINPGTTFTNMRIDPQGDADLYAFSGVSGDVISLRVTDPSGGSSIPAPVLELFRPDGTLAGTHAGNTTAALDVTLEQSGIFIVRVTEVANDHLMTYHLEYQCLQGGCPTLHGVPLVLGVGPKPNDGGWFSARHEMAGNLGTSVWGRVPWPAYNASGRGVRVAAGDVDGDGLDELVVGLDRGGGGWIAVLDDGAHNYALLDWIQVQWAAYNAANGEVWPAVGDLDGDGRAEIVAGLGPGGSGWFEVFDDATANYAHLAFRRVSWPAYAGLASSVVHPAIGNVDGAGASEIIIGLGDGSQGWIEVVNGAASGYNHRSWVQVNWSAYNVARGTVFPAAGDLDGDGRAEIVAGLGRAGAGWMEVLEDASGSFAHSAWLRVNWQAYNVAVGETHPAVGNIDADEGLEIVVGLAAMTGQGAWFETFDHQGAGFASLGWRNLGIAGFTAAGSATYPAIGKFR